MAFRGNLNDFSLPDVFQLVTFSRKTGVLRIKREDGAEGSVWFRDGDVFFAQSNWHTELLGERLVRAQRITPQALEQGAGDSRSRGARRPASRRDSHRRGLHQRQGPRGVRPGADPGDHLRPDALGRGRVRLRGDARGRRGGHRAVGLHRERDHGGQPTARRVESDQEEDPVDGRRLQDGDRARRGHVRDLAQADRVEPAAAGRRHAIGRRSGARDRTAPTSRSRASSTASSRPGCSSSPATTRWSGFAPRSASATR